MWTEGSVPPRPEMLGQARVRPEPKIAEPADPRKHPTQPSMTDPVGGPPPRRHRCRRRWRRVLLVLLVGQLVSRRAALPAATT
ncbi:hypothetical protein BCD48_21400 [Pseudofrankia sp. BMG5.36]|nr:hypothetical protein BCD48_21400 [Pseudofrankia sp. BMG5.36]